MANHYKGAEVRYFEHGLGDYLDTEKQFQDGEYFHCVFAEGLEAYYQKNGKAFAAIRSAVEKECFLAPDLLLDQYFPQINDIKIEGDKPIVLLASQATEQFKVDSKAFWEHFLGLCLQQIEEPRNYTFLVKPHPRQDGQVLYDICAFLREKGLEVVLWEQPELRSFHMEILFRGMYERVKYVFSPFSSTVFYLSQLYPTAAIEYYYSLQSIFPYSQNTPEIYLNRWKDLYELVQGALSKQAIEME